MTSMISSRSSESTASAKNIDPMAGGKHIGLGSCKECLTAEPVRVDHLCLSPSTGSIVVNTAVGRPSRSSLRGRASEVPGLLVRQLLHRPEEAQIDGTFAASTVEPQQGASVVWVNYTKGNLGSAR